MEDSDDSTMFRMDDVDQTIPVNYSIPEILPSSLEKINNFFQIIKPVAKGTCNDILFCLPKKGGTISDLQVVKVATAKQDRARNEADTLEKIQNEIDKEYREHFPQVKDYKTEEGWLAMTAYNHSITLKDLTDYCTNERIEIPLDFLAVLLHTLVGILKQLELIHINHGDFHPGNIVLELSLSNMAAFPPIRIIDFGISSHRTNLCALKSFMIRIAKPYPLLAEPSHHWESFREFLEDLEGGSYDFDDIKRGLDDLIKTIKAIPTTLSIETEAIVQKIADQKMKNDVWVTEEDIKIANVKASSTN